MAIQDQVNGLECLTIKQAQALGLSQLTLTQAPDSELRVGDGASSMRYIDWLAAEQERITWDGDRQAEIVRDGKGGVSLWVDPVAE
jgi:hypothetical protein